MTSSFSVQKGRTQQVTTSPSRKAATAAKWVNKVAIGHVRAVDFKQIYSGYYGPSTKAAVNITKC